MLFFSAFLAHGSEAGSYQGSGLFWEGPMTLEHPAPSGTPGTFITNIQVPVKDFPILSGFW